MTTLRVKYRLQKLKEVIDLDEEMTDDQKKKAQELQAKSGQVRGKSDTLQHDEPSLKKNSPTKQQVLDTIDDKSGIPKGSSEKIYTGIITYLKKTGGRVKGEKDILKMVNSVVDSLT